MSWKTCKIFKGKSLQNSLKPEETLGKVKLPYLRYSCKDTFLKDWLFFSSIVKWRYQDNFKVVYCFFEKILCTQKAPKCKTSNIHLLKSLCMGNLFAKKNKQARNCLDNLNLLYCYCFDNLIIIYYWWRGGGLLRLYVSLYFLKECFLILTAYFCFFTFYLPIWHF